MVVCTYDTYCDVSNNPNTELSRDAYDFLGWGTNKNDINATYPDTNTGISVINLTDINNQTVLLYAIWKEQRIDITYIYADTNGTVAQDSCKINSAFVPQNPPEGIMQGYRFAGWIKE